MTPIAIQTNGQVETPQLLLFRRADAAAPTEKPVNALRLSWTGPTIRFELDARHNPPVLSVELPEGGWAEGQVSTQVSDRDYHGAPAQDGYVTEWSDNASTAG